MSLEQCRLIEFPKRIDARGSLAFVEGNLHAPFEIKRVFYLYDLAPGETRGGHAHVALEQLVIPMAGSFVVTLDDGEHKRKHRIASPATGLYVAPMTWTVLDDFSEGAVCVVLASARYDESDYHRDYDLFLKAARGA